MASEQISIRPVRDPADLTAMLSLYASFVATSTCTWAYPTDPLPDFPAQWAAACARGLPWLLAEAGSPPRLAGYATVGPFRGRAGWRFVGEHSLYVAQPWQRRGVGRALLRALLAACKTAPVTALVAVVSVHPETGAGRASVALHEAEGFERVGRLPRVGAKGGLHLDCELFSRSVRDVGEVEAEEVAAAAAAAASGGEKA